MYTPYVRISTGNPSTVLDVNPTNTLGAIYAPPASPTVVTSSKGYGAQPVMKYVQYKSTSQPTPGAAPAPVYYTDESFTVVSGNAAEAFITAGFVCVAGYLLVNTTSVSTLTAAILQSSYVWIQIGGVLVGATVPGSTAVGDTIIGAASGNFASTRVVAGTPPTTTVKYLGYALTAIASSVGDVMVGGLSSTFWGS